MIGDCLNGLLHQDRKRNVAIIDPQEGFLILRTSPTNLASGVRCKVEDYGLKEGAVPY